MSHPGLHIIFDSAEQANESFPPEIDIVAVHGLNFANKPDHARATWSSSGKLWLSDFLPSRLTKPCRVMLFEYNSSPAIGAVAIKLDDHAKQLLQWLAVRRKEFPQRPLIFICHSLGGLVVKEVLVEATLDQTYKSIMEATCLLVFFATPHQGGKYASVGDVAAGIARGALRKPSNDLIEALKSSSNEAVRRFEQFRHLYEKLLVISFFECESYGKLGIIVDKKSATLNLAGTREKQLPIHADHSLICKFSAVNDGACELVMETVASDIERALELKSIPTEIPSRNTHWWVPRPANSLFTGRTEILQRIESALTLTANSKQQRRFVITGIGGQGKSEICLKIADLVRERFWGVFWIDAGSESTAVAGFLRISKILGSPSENINDALYLLSNTKNDWLIVLDNADSPETDYSCYFPSGARGAVLITSRNPDCSRYNTVGTEHLVSLDAKSCLTLLLQAAETSNKLWSKQELAAKRVIDVLGSHTLALIQAGAYISQGFCSMEKYPEEYQRQCKRLMEFSPKQAQSRYCNVFATFEVAAQLLEFSNNQASQDALDLLHLLAIFHYDNIPLGVFERASNGIQYAQEVAEDDSRIDLLSKWHISQLPQFMQMDLVSWDPFRLHRAQNLLQSLALVTKGKESDSSTVSMHPLTHTWANARQEQFRKQHSWQSIGCIYALSSYGSAAQRPHEMQLRLHLQAFLLQQLQSDTFTSMEIFQVFFQCGRLLNELRMDDLLREILTRLFQHLYVDATEPVEKFLPLHRLASKNLYNIGKAKEAVSLWEKINKIEQTTVTEDHPDRLGSQHELAVAYKANGQIKEAIQLLEHVVAVQKTTLAEDHPSRLASQHTLAWAYEANGQIKEAIQLLEHVVAVQKTTLAEDHPSRLASQHTLAWAYEANGQIKEAIQLLEHVVAVQKTTLAEDHPSRLASQHTLAWAYEANGQIKEAIQLLEHVVAVEKTTLAEDHPSRLTSQHELARAYLANGQIKEAIQLLEHEVAVQKTTLAEDHPDRLVSQHTLAGAYLANGQIKEAIQLLEHVVAVEKTTLAKDHPDRLASQYALAMAYQANRQIKTYTDRSQSSQPKKGFRMRIHSLTSQWKPVSHKK